MKAYTEAMRALCYMVAEQIDVATHAADEADRTAAQEMVDLLIPLAKSWCTDVAETVTSIGIQVHGGMGYIEETGVAQYYRDAKITQIYEGTNGIQAMDLVGRKLPMRAGGVYQDQIARMRATVEELEAAATTSAVIQRRAGGRRRRRSRTPPAGCSTEGMADPVAGPVGRHALPAPVRHHRRRLADGASRRLAAKRLVDAGDGDADFLPRKLVTARFFAEHLLPQVHGLVAAGHRRQGRPVRDSLLNQRFRSEVLRLRLSACGS